MRNRQSEELFEQRFTKRGLCSLSLVGSVVGNAIAPGIGGAIGGALGGAAQSALSGSTSPSSSANQATTQANANSAQAAQQSAQLFAFNQANYQPVEQQWAANALTAGSPAMQEQMAGEAGSTVQNSFNNARNAMDQQNAGLGTKLDSDAAESMDLQSNIAQAGATAGAMNLARQNERAYGNSVQQSVASIGSGLVTGAVGADNASTSAANVAAKAAGQQASINTNQNAALGTSATAITNALNNQPAAAPTVTGMASTPDSLAATAGPNDGNIYNADGSYNTSQGQYKKGGQVKRLVRPPSRTHGYLKGGAARGPGTGTSDSIPVNIDGERPGAIANGEYVLNAKAVKKIGLKRLDRMNLMGLPKGSKMKDGTHLETGGQVTKAQADMDTARGTFDKLDRSAKPATADVPAPARVVAPRYRFDNTNQARTPDEPVIHQTKFASGGRLMSAKNFAAQRRAA